MVDMDNPALALRPRAPRQRAFELDLRTDLGVALDPTCDRSRDRREDIATVKRRADRLGHESPVLDDTYPSRLEVREDAVVGAHVIRVRVRHDDASPRAAHTGIVDDHVDRVHRESGTRGRDKPRGVRDIAARDVVGEIDHAPGELWRRLRVRGLEHGLQLGDVSVSRAEIRR